MGVAVRQRPHFHFLCPVGNEKNKIQHTPDCGRGRGWLSVSLNGFLTNTRHFWVAERRQKTAHRWAPPRPGQSPRSAHTFLLSYAPHLSIPQVCGTNRHGDICKQMAGERKEVPQTRGEQERDLAECRHGRQSSALSLFLFVLRRRPLLSV